MEGDDKVKFEWYWMATWWDLKSKYRCGPEPLLLAWRMDLRRWWYNMQSLLLQEIYLLVGTRQLQNAETSLAGVVERNVLLDR